jgi:hypothetical protein
LYLLGRHQGRPGMSVMALFFLNRLMPPATSAPTPSQSCYLYIPAAHSAGLRYLRRYRPDAVWAMPRATHHSRRNMFSGVKEASRPSNEASRTLCSNIRVPQLGLSTRDEGYRCQRQEDQDAAQEGTRPARGRRARPPEYRPGPREETESDSRGSQVTKQA